MRILILTAEVGDGHLAAARTLTEDLAGHDVEVEVGDALEALGRPLRAVLLDAYRWQIRRAPWLFGVVYRLVSLLAPLRAIGAANLAVLGGRSLRAFVARRDPDVVVSTYPAATSVLGHLRRRGRVRVPVYATITDLDGIAFWTHRGVDLHLVMHDACVADVERRAGAGSAVAVRPLVRAPFFAPRPRAEARRVLGLADDRPLVVVSGGGWGVGDLEAAARVALDLPGTEVVCLAGRDAEIRERLELAFAAEPRVRVLGFTDRMPDLLAAADALVHSTGGVTCLEALASGCPVVAFGAPPGHARLTARRLEALGLGRNARTRAELRAALAETLAAPRPQPLGAAGVVSAAAVVSGDPPQRRRRPRHAVRARAAVGATAMLALAGWTLANDAAYPLAARVLDLEPLSHVPTARPEVGVVVSGGRAEALAAAAALARAGGHASFAFPVSPGRRSLTSLVAAGDEVVPELEPGGLTGWLAADDRLRVDADSLGLSGGDLYLAPPDGFTIGQQLVASADGRRPVVAAVTYGAGATGARRLRGGAVVALELPPNAAAARSVVAAFLADTRRAGLRAVTLGRLVGDRTA